MKKILFAFLLLSATAALCQDTGSIAGALTDKEYNNEPLAFANVLIKGTSKGTTSDFDGLFEIDNVDPGVYTLVFSYLGYETVEIANVAVVAGQTTTVDVAMSASKGMALEEVTVITSTAKDSEQALLLQQKNANLIQEAIGAEALTLKGIDDAAAAVSQISGISKQEGSGNVYVRGLGDRYQNTTMNGLSLPSNDVNKKNIDLNLFSSGIIENVSVSKAYNASFYGDFSAGNVNVDSKEYSGNGYLEVSLGNGINSNAVGQDFLQSEGTSFFGFYNRYNNNPFAIILSHGVDPEQMGAPVNLNGALEGGYSITFRDDSKLSFFGTAAFGNGYEYLQGPARDFTNVLKFDFPETEEYIYSSNTTALANMVYQMKNGHKIKYSSLFVNSATDAVSFFGVNGEGFNRDGITSDNGFFVSNVQFNQDMIFVNQLTGKHRFQEDWVLDWGTGYNTVFSDEPDRKRITLENYQFALDADPNTNPVFFTNTAFENQRFFQSIEDRELNSFVNLSHTASEALTLNFGYNGRTKQRDFNSIRYGYRIFDRTTPVTDVNNLDSFFTIENSSLGGQEGALYEIRNLNPINNDIGAVNRPGLPDNTYRGNLDIHAGFLSAEWQVTEQLLLVPGIRAESVSQDIVYDVINLPPSDPGFRNVQESLFLPSLNARYALSENANLRLGISNTVSFPEFKEVAPFVYEGVTQRFGGNPDLFGGKNGDGVNYSDIYNLDLKYEWFMSRGELFSIAAFGKLIQDPVNRVIAADATGTQRLFRTGEAARVLGLEVELRKNLLTNAEERATLSLGVNAAYTHTRQDLRNIAAGEQNTFGTTFDRSSDALQGASPLIVNTDLNYSPTFGNYAPKATLVFSYFSDRIAALGAGSLGNIVEKGVPTLNFIWKNPIGEHFEANLSATNLLDPNIALIRENTGDGDIIIREYTLGINLGITLKYKF
ncbi:TonB-dependent receptor domain-containing protein [Maribacter sp. 2307ULW6-5]|uniref:TonB-dependent receptor n=1 Tax=Maribacter sp. 2307ULW6-5 TaxID=3386275 RepID=UPI0039BC455C